MGDEEVELTTAQLQEVEVYRRKAEIDRRHKREDHVWGLAQKHAGKTVTGIVAIAIAGFGWGSSVVELLLEQFIIRSAVAVVTGLAIGIAVTSLYYQARVRALIKRLNRDSGM